MKWLAVEASLGKTLMVRPALYTTHCMANCYGFGYNLYINAAIYHLDRIGPQLTHCLQCVWAVVTDSCILSDSALRDQKMTVERIVLTIRHSLGIRPHLCCIIQKGFFFLQLIPRYHK